MAEVFVSYEHKDRGRVEPIIRLIKQTGLSVWWDQSLMAGERFDTAIARELQTARCVLVAWSATSINSPWVRDEAADGRDRDILVPFSLDGIAPPLGFRQYQTPDLSGWTGDTDAPQVRQLILAATKMVASTRMPTEGDPRKPEIEPHFRRSSEAGAADEPAFTSVTASDRGGSRRPLQRTLVRIADSITVVAATLVVVIAATGASSTPTVVWAAPAAATAFGLRAFAQRSWPGLVAGLLIANAVGATVTVWAEPTRGVGPQIILTILAGLAAATTAAAGVVPRLRSGRRLLKLGDLLAAASLPIFFMGILVKQTLNADGAAAALGLRLDAVAIFILGVMITIFWGIFVALRIVAAPRSAPRLLAGLIALHLPTALADGIAAISADHVLGLPVVLLVTIAVTLLILAAVQQPLAKSAEESRPS